MTGTKSLSNEIRVGQLTPDADSDFFNRLGRSLGEGIVRRGREPEAALNIFYHVEGSLLKGLIQGAYSAYASQLMVKERPNHGERK